MKKWKASWKQLNLLKNQVYWLIESAVETHRIALYVNGDNLTYFDSFRVEYIQKEVWKFIWNKNIIANIYRMQAFVSIICRYFCIGFIGFMLKGKRLLEYINLFSSNKYKKNDKILSKHF